MTEAASDFQFFFLDMLILLRDPQDEYPKEYRDNDERIVQNPFNGKGDPYQYRRNDKAGIPNKYMKLRSVKK